MTNPAATNSHAAFRAAQQFVSADRLHEAEAAYRRAVAADPEFHPAYHGLGLLAFRVGKLELATQLIGSAIALAPSVAIYHRDRGEICRRLGAKDEAEREARRASELAPNDPEAHYNLGLALADQERFADAIASYRRAIELDPRHGRAHNNLGSALEKLEDRAAAADAYRAAIAIDDAHMEAHNNLGSVLGWMGDVDGARRCYERALEIDPNSVSSHFNLSHMKRYESDDTAVPILEGLVKRAASLPETERIQLYFALGKMRDDLGDYARAFEAYATGNRLKAATIRHDEAGADRQLGNIIRTFTTTLIERLGSAGNPDPAPTFIVGMPRSGTSLMEQILASHPMVHGAGELKNLHRIVASTAAAAKKGPYPSFVESAAAEDLAVIGRRYADAVHDLAPDAERIVDKMPANFFYLGLIHLALPNAKIIHMVRDPMDSCLSCFTHLFSDTMEFTYDLATLGHYYVRYMKLMAHWRAVLPGSTVLDVRYADLVADVEGETRRVLDHMGLPWDDACLTFHDTERPVRTASLAQVRQPIYQSSVGGWRRFEKQLAPLMAIVEDYR